MSEAVKCAWWRQETASFQLLSLRFTTQQLHREIGNLMVHGMKEPMLLGTEDR